MKFKRVMKLFVVVGISILLCSGTSLAAKKKVLFVDSYHAGISVE